MPRQPKFHLYHSYRTNCTTVTLPPGFGDFLRGSIALSLLALELNFDLKIDFSHHPIGAFIDDCGCNPCLADGEPEEFFGERTNYLKEYLETVEPSSSVVVTTNGHYNKDRVDEKVRSILKESLKFKAEVRNRVDEIIKSLEFSEWVVVHVRVLDHEILHEMHGSEIERQICQAVEIAIDPKWREKIIVISNNETLKKSVCRKLRLSVVEGAAVHLGECSGPAVEERVLNTLIDFLLISMSSGVYSYSPYGWSSGFSKECAMIYNVPFHDLKPLLKSGESNGQPESRQKYRLVHKLRQLAKRIWRS